MSNYLKMGFASGTFDPPHLGHANLFQNAKHSFGLDKIVVLPQDTPDKPEKSSFDARLKMCQALAGFINRETDSIFCFASDARKGNVSEVDSIKAEIKKEFGDGSYEKLKKKIPYIIGADILEKSILQFKDELDKFVFLAMPRSQAASKTISDVRKKYPSVSIEKLGVKKDYFSMSSTHAREATMPMDQILPPDVLEVVVNTEGLYFSGADESFDRVA